MPISSFGPLAINLDIFEFFTNRIEVRGRALQFSYDKGNSMTEYWSSNLHLVRASSGLWLAHASLPAQVRNLFISHSVADILGFCQLRQHLLPIPSNAAFAALGLLAAPCQVSFLKERFVNAKVNTLFDTGITGRVTDCKIALWLAGKDAAFRVVGDLVEVLYRENIFHIPASDFSLSRFEKIIGLRSGIRTHKAKGGFESYHELFMNPTVSEENQYAQNMIK